MPRVNAHKDRTTEEMRQNAAAFLNCDAVSSLISDEVAVLSDPEYQAALKYINSKVEACDYMIVRAHAHLNHAVSYRRGVIDAWQGNNKMLKMQNLELANLYTERDHFDAIADHIRVSRRIPKKEDLAKTAVVPSPMRIEAQTDEIVSSLALCAEAAAEMKTFLMCGDREVEIFENENGEDDVRPTRLFGTNMMNEDGKVPKANSMKPPTIPFGMGPDAERVHHRRIRPKCLPRMEQPLLQPAASNKRACELTPSPNMYELLRDFKNLSLESPAENKYMVPPIGSGMPVTNTMFPSGFMDASPLEMYQLRPTPESAEQHFALNDKNVTYRGGKYSDQGRVAFDQAFAEVCQAVDSMEDRILSKLVAYLDERLPPVPVEKEKSNTIKVAEVKQELLEESTDAPSTGNKGETPSQSQGSPGEDSY